MIMIKIINIYFIQIRHTDDFPSTGTRLVILNQIYTKSNYDNNFIDKILICLLNYFRY